MKSIVRLVAFFLIAAPTGLRAQAFQPAKMAAGRDSLEIVLAQPGMAPRTLGYALMTFTREGDSFRIVNEANLGQLMIQQRDDVLFNATTLMPIAFSAKANIQGRALATDVKVADGRAKGTSQKPGPAGVQDIAVDVPVPAGTLADGVELVLIPTMDLAEGVTTSFQALDGSTGEIKTTTLKVGAKETVTVPAGTFEAWRVEVQTSERVTIFVTAAAPRRVVLLRLESQGLEMRAASKR